MRPSLAIAFQRTIARDCRLHRVPEAGPGKEAEAVGLCASCRFAAVQRSARGSEFWRCRRADTEPGCEFGIGGRAAEHCGKAGAGRWQLLGLAADSDIVAFVIDDHQIAGGPDLVTVRIRVADRNGREDARASRI